MPVLTVHAGRSEAGQRAAASHTAAVASPLVTREALFEQAGIIATPSFGELMGATALLATQPPPAGPDGGDRVQRRRRRACSPRTPAPTSGSPCTTRAAQTRQRLHALIPDGGSVNGPVDTAATVSADDFRQVLEVLAADEDVHAIIALVLRTGATGDLLAAIEEAERRRAARRRGAQPAGGGPHAGHPARQGPRLRLPGGGGQGALPRRAGTRQWRAAPHAVVPAFADVDAERGREIVRAFLAARPDGGWLPQADAVALLAAATGYRWARRSGAGRRQPGGHRGQGRPDVRAAGGARPAGPRPIRPPARPPDLRR